MDNSGISQYHLFIIFIFLVCAVLVSLFWMLGFSFGVLSCLPCISTAVLNYGYGLALWGFLEVKGLLG